MYVKFESDGSYSFYTPEIHGEEIIDDPSYIKISNALYQEVIGSQGIKYLTRDLQLLPVPLETSLTIKNGKIFEFTKENGFSVQGILPDELLVHVEALQSYLNSFESSEELLHRIATQNATDEEALTIKHFYEPWQPGVEYKDGDRVRWGDHLYKLIDGKSHTSQVGWEPDKAVSEWVNLEGHIPAEGETYPDWAPQTSTGGYEEGAIVKHNGKLWISMHKGKNIWEPGAVGVHSTIWREYTE